MRRLKSSSWFVDHSLALKSLRITLLDERNGDGVAACPPCVRSQISSSESNIRFDFGFLESQLAFHRFIHSVWRRCRSCLGPHSGIPRSRSFFRNELSFKME